MYASKAEAGSLASDGSMHQLSAVVNCPEPAARPGNLKVVPGGHLVKWIDGPPRRDVPWPDPDGAMR